MNDIFFTMIFFVVAVATSSFLGSGFGIKKFSQLKLSDGIHSMIISIIIFSWFVGIEKINPWNYEWLLGQGEIAQSYLGWEYFRNSPLLQLPLGANDSLGQGLDITITYTASNTLLSIIFKYLLFFTDSRFQFYGIWIIVSIFLQNYLATKILKRYSSLKQKTTVYLLSLLFVLAPFYQFRLGLGHMDLTAHWLILLVIYNYLGDKQSQIRWILTLVIALLINPYMFVFCHFVYQASIIKSAAKKVDFGNKLIFFLKNITISSLVLFFTIMVTGIYQMGIKSSEIGFGIFRSNLNSVFDPTPNLPWMQNLPAFSRILKDKSSTFGDYEGYAFFGVAFLAIVFIVIFVNTFLFEFKKPRLSGSNIYLLVSAITLYLYSLSNNIVFGQNEIFSYRIPNEIDAIFGTFRASGRMIWLLLYLILIFVTVNFIMLSSKIMKVGKFNLMITTLLLIQVLDGMNLNNFVKDTFNPNYLGRHIFVSETFKNSTTIISKIILDNRVKNITYVYPYNLSNNWLFVMNLGVENKVSVNTGYFARVDSEKLEVVRKELKNSILNNQFRSENLYIIEDYDLFRQITEKNKTNDCIISQQVEQINLVVKKYSCIS